MPPEPPDHLAAVGQIEARIAGPQDEALFDLYTEFVRNETGVDSAAVVRYEGEGEDNPSSHTKDGKIHLYLGDFEPPMAKDDLRRWLCDIHSTIWHEIGHVEHSPRLKNAQVDVDLRVIDSEDPRLFVALDALEDTRQERATICGHGEGARKWLRHNINRGGGWEERARRTAETYGWPIAAAVYAARGTSGVLTAGEVKAFVDLDVIAAVAVEAQHEIWEAFAAIPDDELGDGGPTDAYAVELVERLAHMLPDLDP